MMWRVRPSHVWIAIVCGSILAWACLVQLRTIDNLWRRPQLHSPLGELFSSPPPPPLLPARLYRSNGYLKVHCNGGLNQMRTAVRLGLYSKEVFCSPLWTSFNSFACFNQSFQICDMVTVSRLLNLTLVVPELDKKSFWADTSNFGDIFDINHFIGSLRHEVHIVKRLPKEILKSMPNNTCIMPPVSWSSERYYLNQILPLFSKYDVIHFTKTDSRLANNGLPIELQKLRCYVNYHALKFNEQIKILGNKLVAALKKRGNYVALHLRYEMDMLAFSGCTHGCTEEEADELKRMRYAYPWWREKEIDSEQRRTQGLCPLTPEETALVLQALGFKKNTPIYIASGETYGSEKRLTTLRDAFPQIVKKETLLDPKDLWRFRNHSSQMAALDYMASIASDVFIPTYQGNMAKVVEGHRRYLGFGKSIQLDRRKLVELLDLYQNKTITWAQFSINVKVTHEKRMGQPASRKVIPDKPKDEDYFYANPHECLCNVSNCHGNAR